MLDELQAKPTRKSVKQDADNAAKRAYDRSYRKAAIDAARVEGAAQGAADAVSASGANGGGDDIAAVALEEARQRVVSGGQSSPDPTVGRPSTQKAAPSQLSGERIKHSSGVEVPREFYDLDSASQQRFLAALQERETKKKDESVALQGIGQLLDLRDRDSKRVRQLESMVGSLLSVVEGLQQRLDNQDNSLEVTKSAELAEQLAKLSEAVVGAAAVEASLRNQTAASQVEADRQRDDHRQRLEATERVVSDQQGRLKSSTALMQERSNAVIDELSKAEQQQQKLAVQLTENSDGIARNADTLRAVTGTDFDSAIDLSVKKAFDARLDGALEELIERRYVLLAPTTGTDGYDPKIDSSAKPFLARKNDQSPRA